MHIKRLLISCLFLVSCTHNLPFSEHTENTVRTPSSDDHFEIDARRGSPGEYDAGAPMNSSWLRLYGQVPNYRAIGQKVLGGTDDKFRWIFGPMWYRGRLESQKVKVFVVGQEGAQDENLSNRAFTGSTGTKTQKFLNHLGVYRSYLFMNTFVYTINGQLEPDNKDFNWLEQGVGAKKSASDSPIVYYRHQLFNNMAQENNETLSLIMGVGAGGKASVATWIESLGGQCDPSNDLKFCDTSVLKEKFGVKNKILVIGVPHPGGANPNLGGDAAMQNIIRGFTNAAKRVAEFASKNPVWLPSDQEDEAQFGKYYGGKLPDRLQQDFKYGNAPIPFRDFAFGTNWRMGKTGTSSNRWKSDSIQVFSDNGEYASKSAAYKNGGKLSDNGVDLKTLQKFGMPTTDVAWEPPRAYPVENAQRFDPGPCGNAASPCEFSKALMGWGDLSSYHNKSFISHPSFGYQSIYRGRTSNSQLLIFADQESHDDLFSGRALTGAQGQQLQDFLRTTGVRGDYLILRTLPVDALDDNEQLISRASELAMDPQVMSRRQNIIDIAFKQNKFKAVVAVGPIAQNLVDKHKFGSAKIFKLPDIKQTAQVDAMAAQVASTLGTQKQGNYTAQLVPIPREDLPYHSRWWMGTSGNRAMRALGPQDGPHYYRVYAPGWVSKLKPAPLNSEEEERIKTKP